MKLYILICSQNSDPLLQQYASYMCPLIKDKSFKIKTDKKNLWSDMDHEIRW
jgi:hypothetical protein